MHGGLEIVPLLQTFFFPFTTVVCEQGSGLRELLCFGFELGYEACIVQKAQG